MDERNGERGAQSGPGMIQKAAHLVAAEVTDEQLNQINKYALVPLTAEEVFVFKAVLCDNKVDRSFEFFNVNTLKDLQVLFLGRPVIKDHFRRADNQVARIFDTELIQTGELTEKGELYTQLVAHCYMVRTTKNADLIREIRGGIKKEGSVGCAIKRCLCNICGTDNAKEYCSHWPGVAYKDKISGLDKICTYELDGGRDAYEFSLVAVPAQPAAGVSKSYTGETVFPEKVKGEAVPDEEDQREKELITTIKLAQLRAKNMSKEDK